MTGCPDGHYLDSLLDECISCKVQCRAHMRCASFCERHHCIQRSGHYYDSLIQSCVRCQDICGQHPPQCNPHCQAIPDSKKVSVTEGNANVMASLHLPPDHTLPTYCLLGISLLLLLCIFVFFLWRLRRSQEQPCSSMPTTDGDGAKTLCKDQLVEAGRRSPESRNPEPVETCGFCFPEQPTRDLCVRYTNITHPYTATAVSTAPYSSWGNGMVPTTEEEDRPFKIICSPTQDRTAP
ncbi:tumor necrosis factor receptor superfamily member 13B [Discoglossus pictus]